MGSNPPPPYRGPEPPHWQHTPEPEILPPNGYSAPLRQPQYGMPPVPPPPQPQPRRRSRWSMAPGTYTLVGINVAVFLLMSFRGVSPIMPTSQQLMAWGANNAYSVLYDGQWWRIVTAMFVHGGALHIALNMWCLWNLGLLAEPLMGTFGLVAVYVLTGAAGNLLATLWNAVAYSPATGYPPSVGASGAVFGIAGALIILLKSTRLPVPPVELRKIRRSVIYFAGINLVLGFGINIGAGHTGVMVDNSAHLGGFATGLLFAAPMVPRLGWPRETFLFRRRIAVAMVAGILVLFAFFIVHVRGLT
jgi:rhomboid protease GluP